MEQLLWICATSIALLIALAIGSKTVRRCSYTVLVLLGAGARVLRDRLRGQNGSGPVRLRESFERLGPSYVKLAQLVASSEGMFPAAYCLEFQKCLDRVPAFSSAEVERIVREQLGKPLQEVFGSLEPEPLASASMAQVHGAILRDGTEVVLKVQRPNLQGILAADLRVLRLLARSIELLPLAKNARPRALVEDFASNLGQELDFRNEALNLDQFNRIMRQHGFGEVACPTPVHALTSTRLLVMERFHGRRIDDERARAEYADQIEDKLILGMRAWFRCLLVHGFFHGDVHAGNLMVLDDGRIGFLDFGIVGRLEGERKRLVSEFLIATAMRDYMQLARTLLAISGVRADEVALAADLERQLGALLDPSKPTKYADLLPVMTRTGFRYRFTMPRDFVLILKQMIYFDRYAKLLAPKLNIFADPRILKNLMEDLLLAQKTQAA